jgi:hypothetical protein
MLKAKFFKKRWLLMAPYRFRKATTLQIDILDLRLEMVLVGSLNKMPKNSQKIPKKFFERFDFQWFHYGKK